MRTNQNIPYYLTAIALFILLKFGYTVADNDDLSYLLTPTDKLVSLLTGSQSVYFPGDGYYHGSLKILIDKSCSGFNFWILSFLLLAYLTVKYFDKAIHKILVIPVSLLCAFVLTIFVNASRIYASLVIQTHTKNVLLSQQHLVHEAIGIITNLSFLTLTYYLTEKILIQTRHNAKLAQP